jgi:hypothetical protein
MRNAKGIRVCLALALGLPSLAFGWSDRGHMQIADIAWVRLTPASKRRIGVILFAGDPAFRPLSPTNMASVRAMFGKAATWCDFIKGNPSPQYDPLIETLNAQSPGVNPPPGNHLGIRSEDVRCKTWHYFDTPIPSGPPARASNAKVALKNAIRKLARASIAGDAKTACFYLYWVEHVTGDLHQPLHCASFFGPPFQVKGDHGGNSYHILVPFKSDPNRFSKSNLHRFWDDGIDQALTNEGLTSFESATDKWTAERGAQPDRRKAGSANVDQWIAQGAQIAKRLTYSLAPGARVTPVYAAAKTRLCRKLAILAGYRLAKVLNDRLR